VITELQRVTDVVDLCERQHLTDHSPCRLTAESSAEALVKSGQYQEAWDALSIALKHLKRANEGMVEGNELALRYRVGDVLYQWGRLEQALAVQGPALEMYIRSTGECSPQTRALGSLGRTLLTQGDKEGFLEVGKDVIEAQLRESPQAMGRTFEEAQTLFFLAQCYRWIGYPETASKFYFRVIRGTFTRPRWWFFGILAAAIEVSLVPVGLVRLRFHPLKERAKVPTRLMDRRLVG